MMEQTVQPAISHRWYARPVFVVSTVHRALDCYIGTRAFEKPWHEADGKVNRGVRQRFFRHPLDWTLSWAALHRR